jgi:hypothetical protein
MEFDEVAFATERSNNAAKAANENSRPMAQYALLINGAAASAVIAFLSKDKIDPTILAAAPWALCLYAAGAVFGALAMFFMTESLDYWNTHWMEVARKINSGEAEHQRVLGVRFWWIVRIVFWLSIGCFVGGSGTLALALLHSAHPILLDCILPPG